LTRGRPPIRDSRKRHSYDGRAADSTEPKTKKKLRTYSRHDSRPSPDVTLHVCEGPIWELPNPESNGWILASDSDDDDAEISKLKRARVGVTSTEENAVDKNHHHQQQQQPKFASGQDHLSRNDNDEHLATNNNNLTLAPRDKSAAAAVAEGKGNGTQGATTVSLKADLVATAATSKERDKHPDSSHRASLAAAAADGKGKGTKVVPFRINRRTWLNEYDMGSSATTAPPSDETTPRMSNCTKRQGSDS